MFFSFFQFFYLHFLFYCFLFFCFYLFIFWQRWAIIDCIAFHSYDVKLEYPNSLSAILHNWFCSLLKKSFNSSMTLRWTPLRFRFYIWCIAKIRGRFIPKMSFSSYPCAKLLILFSENIFHNRFAKNVLNKQLWWYVFVICKIHCQFIAFIQQILSRENDAIFLCKT